MKKKIFVILGNQLFNLSFFSQFKKDHTFFLAEDFGLCTYEKHHKHKILLFLSAMRSFRDELQESGFEVIYKTIEEDDFKISYTEKLNKLTKELKIESVSKSFLVLGEAFEVYLHYFWNCNNSGNHCSNYSPTTLSGKKTKTKRSQFRLSAISANAY